MKTDNKDILKQNKHFCCFSYSINADGLIKRCETCGKVQEISWYDLLEPIVRSIIQDINTEG